MASPENSISAVERGYGHGCLARPRIAWLVAVGATMDLLLVAVGVIKTKAHSLVRWTVAVRFASAIKEVKTHGLKRRLKAHSLVRFAGLILRRTVDV
ncbi:hypothetical protein WN943_003114 [Citrus x changshan-huyou]